MICAGVIYGRGVRPARPQRITELEAENAALRARTAELEKKVEELTQLVLMLKERLDRNSGNSGQPPSSDSPDQRGGAAREGSNRR